jgi:hypothetical protein
VHAPDVHHPLVLAVLLQEVLAEPEEGGIGDAIVFQDNGIVHLLEHPANAAPWPPPAPQVALRKVALDLAGPVHARHNVPHGRTSLDVLWPVGTRTVGDEKQAFRPCFGDLGEDAGGVMGPIKDDQSYRCTHASLPQNDHNLRSVCKVTHDSVG